MLISIRKFDKKLTILSNKVYNYYVAYAVKVGKKIYIAEGFQWKKFMQQWNITLIV